MKVRISSLSAIKSLRSTGRRSNPGTEGSTYLELYMSTKEKERIEEELSNLDRRRQKLQGKLDDINNRMDKLQKPEAATREKASQEVGAPRLTKEWKTMSATY
jgi:predicted  nucleic acid-binding Zn-ribbon protein